VKLSSRLHAWVYRRSGGRLLSRMGGQGVLLLTTTGRRSGLPRTTPVGFVRDGDALVLVAAGRGAPRPPAWFANLRADPSVSVQIGAERRALWARVAEGEERARLWEVLTRANRWLERTRRRAGRELPVVVLGSPR